MTLRTAFRDDPDIKQMIDTVQRLEASLQDCAVHGHQKMVDAFIACQLTPAILNRWNSPVLDGLWQAVTGRTPDGITPFALNPPHAAPELLSRLVWPKAYPNAMYLVLERMNVDHNCSLLLAPAIVTCACAGHIDMLKGLLAHPLNGVAYDCTMERLSNIAVCSNLPCFEVILPHLIASGSTDLEAGLASALSVSILALHLNLTQFMLSVNVLDQFDIGQVLLAAAGLAPSPRADAIFELLFSLVARPSVDILSGVLRSPVASNRTVVVQRVLGLGIDAATCHAAVVASCRWLRSVRSAFGETGCSGSSASDPG